MNINEKYIDIISWNVENSFFQVIEDNCRKHSCSLIGSYYRPSECKHEQLSKNQIEMKKKENWDIRVPKFAEFLVRANLLFLQEVDGYFLQKLVSKIKEIKENMNLNFIEIDENPTHGPAILYDSNEFDLIKKIFTERFCAAIEIKIKNTDKIVRIASVHITGYDIDKNVGAEKGNLEIEIMINKIHENSEQVNDYIIAGDFNAPRKSQRYKIMKKNGFKAVHIHSKMPQYTNVNLYTSTLCQIDFIFVKKSALKLVGPETKLPENQILMRQERLSDHLPIYFSQKISTDLNNSFVNSNNTYTTLDCSSQMGSFVKCIKKPIVFLLNVDCSMIENKIFPGDKKIICLSDMPHHHSLDTSGNILYLVKPYSRIHQNNTGKISTSILFNAKDFDCISRDFFDQKAVTAIDLIERESKISIRIAVVNLSPKFNGSVFVKNLKNETFDCFVVSGLFSKKDHEKTKIYFQKEGLQYLSKDRMCLSNIEFN